MSAPAAPAPALAVHDLTVAVQGRELVCGLSMQFAPGAFCAILGRNGTGKTLTLHTLAGLRSPRRGEVRLADRPLASLRRRDIARAIGLLTQDSEAGFPATVLESVLIARHPHLPLLGWEGTGDLDIAEDALRQAGLLELAGRGTDTLSGGEQRRCAIAALLAQQPRIFLLDEPTNHLDPQQQREICGLFRRLADGGATVIATLHDPTVAARFADHALLLHGNGRWSGGAAGEVLNAQSLSSLYLAPMEELRHGGRKVFVGG
ncbi:MAG TPA: ABC transporter ATP-binding protein [Steroidobacteraceae bacterium]|nr:ABC transporter ATP-binding protein [Steroidobacteraceae bacterium]